MTERKRFMPLGVDLRRLPCLVVGGGTIGTRKAKLLMELGGCVTVLAPEASPFVSEGAARKWLVWIRAEYSTRHLEGFRMVVAATSDRKLNARIGKEAEERGVLCCVASAGRRGRVIFPAVCRIDGLTVGVHSDGLDCKAAKTARDLIARILGKGGPRAR